VQEHTPTRRSVVTVAGAAALGVAGVGTLAACGGSSSGSTTTSAAPAASSAAAAAPAASSAAAGGSAAAPIAKLADVPVGGAVAADLAGAKIILSQPTAGKVVAFSAICTHQGCPVAPKGATLACPCHGSVFDAATGAVTQGPATKALPAVSVKVDGDNIVPA
jgi:Rieske Fe-S protein